MKTLLLVMGILFPLFSQAEGRFVGSRAGDYYVYVPSAPKAILVVAHGMFSNNDDASTVAQTYLSRWVPYADTHSAIVIAPVFDTARFGNAGGGYGGYRNLFGRYEAADQFVNRIVDEYSARIASGTGRFYLYGHSAGGQFVNRYVVTHPERVIHAVVSAAGRYTYPTQAVKWPYGAQDLVKRIRWSDGHTASVWITKSLTKYADAASKVSIVVGGRDLQVQPKRPAHQGRTRIELAQSWARAMNENARRYGVKGNIQVHVIPGIGHSSARLTPHCAEILFAGK